MSDLKDLYKNGFAIHWLKPKSKAPLLSGWTKLPRASLEELKVTYSKNNNVGVRLGKFSKVNGGYLCVVDCDVKSSSEKHLQELEKKLSELKLSEQAPVVKSGRGNGSKHIYVVTPEPQKPFRFAQSKDTVEVFIPSILPSKRDLKILGKEKCDKGLRLRPAWEISVMGEGQQVALPPSVHPDSGKRYAWVRPFKLTNLPVVMFKNHGGVVEPPPVQAATGEGVFRVVDVDISKSNLSKADKDLIISGTNSIDRSVEAYVIAQKMLNHGFTENEILSVLTNREYFLGAVGFDHAKTEDRTRAAAWVRKYTLEKSKKQVQELASAFENVPIENEKILDKEKLQKQLDYFNEVDDWTKQLERVGGKEDAPPKSTLKNVMLILENECEGVDFVARDAFKVEDFWLMDTPWGCYKGENVKDVDAVKIKVWLAQHYRFEPSVDKIDEALNYFITKNAFHPVREYLDSLSWDGVERVDTWLSEYLGAIGDAEYLAAVGSKTLIAMVARIYSPGIKYDHVLILEGDQGVGKSTAVSILSGKDWFSDNELPMGDKDAVINMQGVWVYELGELSSMNRVDVNRMKQFTTRTIDKIRPPYGKRLISFPRQCIFIGTTNKDEYLKDDTGNRRFWPVKLERKLNLKKLRRDRDQLLAEAAHRFWIGEELFISDLKLQKVAESEQSERVEIDEIQYQLSDFLEGLEHEKSVVSKNENAYDLGSNGPFRVTDLVSVFSGIQGLKNDRYTQMRLATALKNLGFKRRTKRFCGKLAKFWEKE